LKSEVYLYLARVGEYKNDDRDEILDDRTAAIELEASDMLSHKAGIQAKERAVPAVTDLASYMDVRVKGQIDGFYRPRSDELRGKITTVRRVQAGLSSAGVLAGAAAAAFGGDKIAVWVPVLTTVAAAVAAHSAAERYEFLLTEYLRTAEELERLAARRGRARSMSDYELAQAAEHVISIQNEGWMAKLNTEPDGAADPSAQEHPHG
jgi:hypothetical protein